MKVCVTIAVYGHTLLAKRDICKRRATTLLVLETPLSLSGCHVNYTAQQLNAQFSRAIEHRPGFSV